MGRGLASCTTDGLTDRLPSRWPLTSSAYATGKTSLLRNPLTTKTGSQSLHHISSAAGFTEFAALWRLLWQNTLAPNRDASISWKWEASQNYSARSAYCCQFIGSTCQIDFAKLWKARVAAKCKFFCWLWHKRRIVTNNNLERPGLPHNPKCNLCDQDGESLLHLILHCLFTRSVWLLAADWVGCQAVANLWWNDVICPVQENNINVSIYTFWNLWKEHHRRVF